MHRSALSSLLVVASLAAVFDACAQDAGPAPPVVTIPPRPQPQAEMQKSLDAAMGAMVPMMGRMADATIEAQLASAERPETAERIATFKHNLYEALQRKGFNAQQALQITLATSPPSAGGISK